MAPEPRATSFYVVGGTMPPDSESYIERDADAELFTALQRGELCYVLTSRQMGKSSLMARTARKLRDAGVRTVTVDLTAMGRDSPAQWYYGFCHTILRGLEVPLDLPSWWGCRGNLPYLQRLTEVFEQVLASHPGERIVVFIDEIDYTISLPFSDEFFAAIRAAYNARALRAEFTRLSFVLLGVATPVQLIKDPTRTPFNVGRQIDLADFNSEQVRQLLRGLPASCGDPEQVLDRVIYWTAGHPYLTQKVCRAMAEGVCIHGGAAPTVDAVVERSFLAPEAVASEGHLRFVAERLKQELELRPALGKLLSRIRHSRDVVWDPASALHGCLRLSGLAGVDAGGRLTIRNRIYETVFAARWTRSDRALAARWRRRALAAEFASKRDEALLSWLRVAQLSGTAADRGRAGLLVGEDYPALQATIRHSQPITAVAFSPDGRTVLAASQDGSVRLWDGSSGEPRGEPVVHRGAAWSAVFSPDGRWAASGGEDGVARLWPAGGGEQARSIRHAGAVGLVVFSPDSQLLATACENGEARLWRTSDGKQACAALPHSGAVEAAAFSPDSRRMATASANEVCIWNTEGVRTAKLWQHEGRVSALLFLADGATVLTAGEDRMVSFWDAETGQRYGEPLHHEGWIRDATIAGGRLFTAGEDGTARIWDLAQLASAPRVLPHSDWVRSVSASAASGFLITGAEDGRGRIWSTGAGKLSAPPLCHEGRVMVTAISPDGATVATGSYDGTARIWRLPAAGGPIAGLLPHGGVVETCTLSPDGTRLVTTTVGAGTMLWDVPALRPVCIFEGAGAGARVVRFYDDGRCFLTAGDAGAVEIRESATGEALPWTLESEGTVLDAAVRTDLGLAAAGTYWEVRLYSLLTGERVRTLHHPEARIDRVLFSPNGKALLSISEANKGRVWGTETGEPLFAPLTHDGPILDAAFNADGSLLATASADHSVALWRMGSGRALCSPLLHDAAVCSVAFSPDGGLLLSGGADRTLRLWRADTGAALGQPLIHKDPIRTAGFSPDGAWFYAITATAVYFYSSSGQPLASRLLNGAWIGNCVFCRDTEWRLRLTLAWTASALRVVTLSPSDSAPSAASGIDWERRLGLRIDQRDRIVPRVPGTRSRLRTAGAL